MEEELAGCLSLAEVCPEFNKGDIDKLLEEFPQVLRNEPGNTGSAELKIELVLCSWHRIGFQTN